MDNSGTGSLQDLLNSDDMGEFPTYSSTVPPVAMSQPSTAPAPQAPQQSQGWIPSLIRAVSNPTLPIAATAAALSGIESTAGKLWSGVKSTAGELLRSKPTPAPTTATSDWIASKVVPMDKQARFSQDVAALMPQMMNLVGMFSPGEMVEGADVLPVVSKAEGLMGKVRSGIREYFSGVAAPTAPVPESTPRYMVPGSDVTVPNDTYMAGVEAKKTAPVSGGKNIWVRQTASPTNADRTLLVQFSNDLLGYDPTRLNVDTLSESESYANKLYGGVRPGYDRPADFWELPDWQTKVANSFPNADHYTVRDPKETIEFMNKAGYKNVAFSALDVNTPMIKDIATAYPGHVVVGGYVDMGQFKDLPNVSVFGSPQEFAESEGLPFKPGADYRFFAGTPTVPRLTLSSGCLHSCAFCSMPRQIVQESRESVLSQADAIAKDLPSPLVYLNDKTFGQAPNHTMLPEIYDRIKAKNPDFNGFVVQTTAAQMNKIAPEFIDKAGIKYVELGLESFNDPILKAMHKPATEELFERAADKIRNTDASLVPNVIVGLPGETQATYDHTRDFLERNKDIISHVNVYNLTVYKDAELAKSLEVKGAADTNQQAFRKSWMIDPAVHDEFSKKVFSFGDKQLAQPRRTWSNAQQAIKDQFKR